MIKAIQILLAFILMCASCSRAQTEPDAGGLAVGVYGSGGTMGGGGGAYLGIYDAGPFRRIWNNGFFLDLGVTGPTRKATADGVFSFNSQSTYLLHRGPDRIRKPGLLFWNVGYSRLFSNGNGVNYGGGLVWRSLRGPKHTDYTAIRLEFRETFVPGWGRQPGFRVAYEGGAGED